MRKKKKKNKAGGIMLLDIIHNSMVLVCVHECAHTHTHTYTHKQIHVFMEDNRGPKNRPRHI